MGSALSPAARQDAIDTMASGVELDVLVIGGGVVGAGAALDAATRGLRTGLIEQRDFASGTSSKDGRSSTRTSARLRWACGVAARPRSEASHSPTTAVDNGRAAAKSSAKRSALSWRDSAAEAGQVLEYSTAKRSARCRWPSSRRASISTG